MSKKKNPIKHNIAISFLATKSDMGLLQQKVVALEEAFVKLIQLLYDPLTRLDCNLYNKEFDELKSLRDSMEKKQYGS